MVDSGAALKEEVCCTSSIRVLEAGGGCTKEVASGAASVGAVDNFRFGAGAACKAARKLFSFAMSGPLLCWSVDDKRRITWRC